MPPTATTSASCAPCPYYRGNNPSQAQIAAALDTAASQYGLPRYLLYADAWQESHWHEDVLSCDGGIGLMQLQYYTWPWLNQQVVPQCGLTATNYDPATLQGNASLGAKFLKWISCYYSYWGDETPGTNTCGSGTSPSDPAPYTIACYYKRAGLPYPDASNPAGYCPTVFNDPNNPWYAALPSTTADPWSCPYSATTGDPTLLDITLSAYNEGPGNTNTYGIQNWWYVQSVEGYIPQFASGALP